MQQTTDTKNKLKELKGRAKAGFGKLIGNEQMQIEGKAEATGSMAKHVASRAGERVKGDTKVLGGAVKHDVGEMTDDEKLKAKGKRTEREGRARQRTD